MTQQVKMPEPFMYGIMGPDGEPYFGELCVSGDKDDLAADISDLNDGNDTGPYKEVGLITTNQAETYATAKVREALEAVIQNLERESDKAREFQAYAAVLALMSQAELIRVQIEKHQPRPAS